MASASKLIWRQALAPLVGDYIPGVCTSNGAADGSTFISSYFIGHGKDTYRGWWALITSGTYGGATPKYRRVTAFDSVTGIFTITAPLGGIVANTVTFELHQFSPDFFTRAANSAIRRVWPDIYLPGLDSSLTVTAGTYSYTMPTGLTQDMITKVMVEGEGSFDEIPTTERLDVSYPPDNSKIWFNRSGPIQEFTTGLKLYLFLAKYLTALDVETTQGQLTTDTTAKIELEQTTQAWQALLAMGKAMIFNDAAARAGMERYKMYTELAAAALKEAEALKDRYAMVRSENAYVA